MKQSFCVVPKRSMVKIKLIYITWWYSTGTDVFIFTNSDFIESIKNFFYRFTGN